MGKYQHYAFETSEGKRIFGSWEECQEFRDRHPKNARYKGFANKWEAEEFLGLPVTEAKPQQPPFLKINLSPNSVVAYTDGSFNLNTRGWGYGAIFVDPATGKSIADFQGNGTKYSDARNVTGEIYGAVRATQEAVKCGYEAICIAQTWQEHQNLLSEGRRPHRHPVQRRSRQAGKAGQRSHKITTKAAHMGGFFFYKLYFFMMY